MPPRPPRPAAQVCRTCRQALSAIDSQDDDGQWQRVWLHGAPADHDADPVPRIETDETQLEPVCDFCNIAHNLNDSWVYPADPFTVTGQRSDAVGPVVERGFDDDGQGWGACSACHRLIEADNQDALAARAASIAARRLDLPYEHALEYTRMAHATFFAARAGEPYPARECRPH